MSIQRKLSREEIAKKEVGHTTITSVAAKIVTLFFLISLFAVPLTQALLSGFPHFTAGSKKGENATLFQQIKEGNHRLLQAIANFETELEEESFLRRFFLPPLQLAMLKLGQGNEKVVVGKEGWLYYRPDVDALIGPPFLDAEQLARRAEAHKQWESPLQPDPVKAILDFKQQLATRGIALVLVPVPLKPGVNPENLGQIHGEKGEGILSNRSYEKFLQEVADLGVQVVDSAELLTSAQYLKTDTHWLPAEMALVAKGIAGELNPLIASEITNEISYKVGKTESDGEGDIARMLTLSEKIAGKIYPKQRVELQQVVSADDTMWQPKRDAEILLLGDSFTNIYSAADLGWGSGAGLAEHLSLLLGTPVDLIAQNDNGAFATRQMLAADLARGRDRLAGKKVVIWEFSARELSFGDWKLIPLKRGEPVESAFFTAESAQPVTVTATVAEISKSPRPGSVPYRDNLVTLHLIDVEGVDLSESDALVYGFGMKDNELTRLGQIRAGEKIRITLQAWDDVEGKFGSIRRTSLEDDMLELELPNWGELEKM